MQARASTGLRELYDNGHRLLGDDLLRCHGEAISEMSGSRSVLCRRHEGRKRKKEREKHEVEETRLNLAKDFLT